MFRIGWNSTLPESAKAGDHVIKELVVPRGAWIIELPFRVRWGGAGPQGANFGISILWRDWEDYDPPVEVPLKWVFSDHLDIEAGTPGDADNQYTLSCGIVTNDNFRLFAILRTTGDNVAHVVDGDGKRWAGGPW